MQKIRQIVILRSKALPCRKKSKRKGTSNFFKQSGNETSKNTFAQKLLFRYNWRHLIELYDLFQCFSIVYKGVWKSLWAHQQILLFSKMTKKNVIFINFFLNIVLKKLGGWKYYYSSSNVIFYNPFLSYRLYHSYRIVRVYCSIVR